MRDSLSKPMTSRPAPVAAALVALLLGGCSLMPVYERPAAPVAEHWPGLAAPQGASAPVAMPPWQDFVRDERLRALIAQAMEHNRDLRVAVLAIEQARAQHQIRAADLTPTVNLGATGSRQTTSQDNISSAYTVGLTFASWEIDFFGRIASLKEAALAQVLASEEARRAVQTSLVAAVASTWLNLQTDEELLALTRSTLATREESLRLVQMRYRQGVASALDLRQAELNLKAANANIGAARAAFFPRISLTASAGTASGALSGLFKDGTWGWSLAPQALLPIFDAGRNQAALESAQAARSMALAQYEKAIQTAFREVADALAGRATLADQVSAQQAQAEAEAERLRLADLRYRNGVASSLEVLDAQRSVFSAQQALAQTRLALRQNQVALYKALGGGWADQAPETD